MNKIKVNFSRDFPATEKGDKVDSGTWLKVLEISITAAVWTPIKIPLEDVACKSISISTRDGSNWKLSHNNGGDYKTIQTPEFSIDLAAKRGDRLFYAQGTSSTTLEILLLD